tara:strand:+ start:1797 stop:2519 length:723 start_codon:yes stop_codon:yes gene_type:complete
MSGHSKWSTIKRKKGAADAKRGVIFTRISKDITIASKDGGSNPDMNPSLRLAIKKAKAANMPAANIERAIKKGTGELPGVKYEDFIYEGYGPSSVAIMIQVMTDNKNRTFPEIRNIMTKNNGSIGSSGCVNWIFEKKGIFEISIDNISEDNLMKILDNLSIEDIFFEDEFYEVLVAPDDFETVSNVFDENNINYDGEITLLPSNTVKISDTDLSKVVKLLELLEDHEDVQKVYSNFEVIK